MESGSYVEKVRVPKLWRYSVWITSAFSVFSALVYLVRQFMVFGVLEDSVFVVVLLLNSIVAGVAGLHLYGQSAKLFKLLPFVHHDQFPPDKIFGSKRNILFGVIFAFIISSCVFQISPWREHPLNFLLCFFVFFVNIQIGIGIGALTMFWILTQRSIQLMDIRILNLSRPDIAQFLNMISFTVLVVGFLSSAAVLSLLFSKFDISFAVAIFSFFSLNMVILSYFVPLSPLIVKLKSVKLQELDKIEKKIDAYYKSALANGGVSLEVDKLLIFRNEIQKIRIVPPNGQFSVLTAVSATFLSFLPTLVQHLLNLYR